MRLLSKEYPGSARDLCALAHDGPFQLLVATILSAQCTDERVNMVTPGLFRRYPDAASLAEAAPAELEELIKPTGFFRSKSNHLIGASQALAAREDGSFPTSMEELTALPGVGRKTANVVLSVELGVPGLPVDTHVIRVSRRLGLTRETDPVKIESDLTALVPPDEWGGLSLRLILHGRRVCIARRPRCESCLLASLCPSAGIGSISPGRAKAPARRSAGRTAL